MPFHKIHAQKISDAVVQQIESLILHGHLRPGDRLPAERELAETLGVSRPTLREALARLQVEALLVSRPGSGVYVADLLGAAFSPALVSLIARNPAASADFIAFRKDLEGLAAERAAKSAGDLDLDVINAIFRKMQSGQDRRDAEAEAALDAEFHLSIVQASHNLIAQHMMRAMQDVLRAGMLRNHNDLFTNSKTRAELLRQHEAINAALQARDGGAARSAIEVHLDYVSECLAAQEKLREHDAAAQLRLQRNNG